jgi:hypothetical protein
MTIAPFLVLEHDLPYDEGVVMSHDHNASFTIQLDPFIFLSLILNRLDPYRARFLNFLVQNEGSVTTPNCRPPSMLPITNFFSRHA